METTQAGTNQLDRYECDWEDHRDDNCVVIVHTQLPATGEPIYEDHVPRWMLDDGSLSTELLAVLTLSIIPTTIVLVFVARLVGMVAGVS